MAAIRAPSVVSKAPSIHVERSGSVAPSAAAKPSVLDLVDDAKAATAKEHSMSLWTGIQTYPKAIGWSVLFSSAIIMEGYDVVLMASFYAFGPFQEKYGLLQDDGTYQLPAHWQAGISNAMNVGQIIGLFINGIVSEKFGYRKTMLASLVCTIAFIFILFFAQDKATLLAGELCIGMPLGVFQTLTVTYATEVCPVVLRPYLTTYVNACWVIGQLIGSGVLKGMLNRKDQWAYRIPFAIQWIWPPIIMVGVAMAPESPWWLVRVNRTSDAEASLRRLATKSESEDNDAGFAETVAMMVHTNEIEKEMQSGTSYLDCFKGVDLRRTEVACFTWAVQNLCGAGLMGYSTYGKFFSLLSLSVQSFTNLRTFYTSAGLPESEAFSMSLGQYGLGLLGTGLSWVLMSHVGRRKLYVCGLWALFTLLMIIGFISLAPGATRAENPNAGAAWATGSMLLVYTFLYDSTVGPICYSLVSELPSMRLRVKTVVLARNLYNVFSIVNGVIIPYMLNPSAWNWAGKAGFFWAGLCLASATWAYFRLPEPKGRTFAELDVLFERRVSARKFARTNVDLFGEAEGEGEKGEADQIEVKH